RGAERGMDIATAWSTDRLNSVAQPVRVQHEQRAGFPLGNTRRRGRWRAADPERARAGQQAGTALAQEDAPGDVADPGERDRSRVGVDDAVRSDCTSRRERRGVCCPEE